MTEQLKQAAQQIGATAEYWGNLAQQKADADAKRGVSMPVSYYASTVVGALLTANPALTTPQPAQAGARGVVLPAGWVPLTIEHEPGYPEEVAFGPQRMMDRLKKWLDKHFAALATQPSAQAAPEPDTCRKRPRCGRADPCAWLEKQATQQAAGEPAGEPVAWRYKIPTHGGGTAWTHTRPQPECLIEAQPLYTHPAPGVPEAWDEGYKQGVEDERTSEANIGIAGFGAKVAPARQNPYRAAQAKGADHA